MESTGNMSIQDSNLIPSLHPSVFISTKFDYWIYYHHGSNTVIPIDWSIIMLYQIYCKKIVKYRSMHTSKFILDWRLKYIYIPLDKYVFGQNDDIFSSKQNNMTYFCYYTYSYYYGYQYFIIFGKQDIFLNLITWTQ